VILKQHMPIAVAGLAQGLSMLFPMEKLFERYVETRLRSQLLPDAKLKPQAASQHLCEDSIGKMFRLKPDLLIDTPEQRWILDTKWKRLQASQRDKNYQLSQSDFYQLFAYGHKYRREAEVPKLVLIYPCWAGLPASLPAFDFGAGMSLWVLPFDLYTDRIVDADIAMIPLRSVS
jgi:5-methylcytosine-specific restriction enzyme subunit McrC